MNSFRSFRFCWRGAVVRVWTGVDMEEEEEEEEVVVVVVVVV